MTTAGEPVGTRVSPPLHNLEIKKKTAHTNRIPTAIPFNRVRRNEGSIEDLEVRGANGGGCDAFLGGNAKCMIVFRRVFSRVILPP
jgi:hypothetical protein